MPIGSGDRLDREVDRRFFRLWSYLPWLMIYRIPKSCWQFSPKTALCAASDFRDHTGPQMIPLGHKNIGREINIWTLGTRIFHRQHFRNFYYLSEKSDSSVPRAGTVSHRQYANHVVEIFEVLPFEISRSQSPNVYLSANAFVAQWDHLRTI